MLKQAQGKAEHMRKKRSQLAEGSVHICKAPGKMPTLLLAAGAQSCPREETDSSASKASGHSCSVAQTTH